MVAAMLRSTDLNIRLLSLSLSLTLHSLPSHQLILTSRSVVFFINLFTFYKKKNINCSIEESMERFRQVTQMATTHSIPIRGYISCVVACPYQGPILPSQVAKVLEYMMMHLNCHEISLGDTIGVATPASTIAMLEAAQAVVGSNGDSSSTATTRTKLAVHFHDTYGQALANILVSLERGIDTIDSSVAGLGGCPYAKGASGNVATEDVLYMLQGLGVETGIDLDKMVDAAEFITGVLGRPSRSRAGLAIAAKRQGNIAAIT
jgi:hydroxymethylglutaryl-CoA lyase